ncbi:MAG: histidine kinase [Bacteroidetes bacterium]|nr:histidine kinase [Fibrella sp.]
MNTTLPSPNESHLSYRLTGRREQLQSVWTRYWPLLIMAISLVWLGLSLHQKTLDVRLARYYELIDTEAHMKTAQGKSSVGYEIGYQTGRQAGVLIGLFLSVLLPYFLLLTAVGHYKYWYVTRYTLLMPGRGGKWAYGFIMAFLTFILLGISLFSFGKVAARAGIVDLFPFVTTGYLVGYSMLIHFRERQRDERNLAQSSRQAELDALKARVNPPFLFHALRGLHKTAVAENLPRTTESLDQLTGIMQYVLEESRNQTTDVAREIEFIRDYLRLQQLRLPSRDTIRITTEVDWDGQPACIVPLLLNPLIENAFKYGISIQYPCFVDIHFRVTDNVLRFTTENSVLAGNDLEKGTGLGLKNVRRRLELAYPDRHKLTISDQDGVYKVDLNVKLA